MIEEAINLQLSTPFHDDPDISGCFVFADMYQNEI